MDDPSLPAGQNHNEAMAQASSWDECFCCCPHMEPEEYTEDESEWAVWTHWDQPWPACVWCRTEVEEYPDHRIPLCEECYFSAGCYPQLPSPPFPLAYGFDPLLAVLLKKVLPGPARQIAEYARGGFDPADNSWCWKARELIHQTRQLGYFVDVTIQRPRA